MNKKLRINIISIEFNNQDLILIHLQCLFLFESNKSLMIPLFIPQYLHNHYFSHNTVRSI